MNQSTSFSLSDEFRDFLATEAAKSERSKTQYIIDAVYAYAKGKTLESSIIDKIKLIESSEERTQKQIEEIRVLCMQILKNQQGG
jgi:uncharacterized protein (DUF1778 family)